MDQKTPYVPESHAVSHTLSGLGEALRQGYFDERLQTLYGRNPERLSAEKERYARILAGYRRYFGEGQGLHLFSVPGRSEVGGNHTDHNHGRVLACSVNLDIIAAARVTGGQTVTVRSEGFEPDVVELSADGSLPPVEAEKGASQALVRGVCARLQALGYKVGGFTAYTSSNVLKGSGLSSSAAYEVMIANIVSHLFNGGSISPVVMAQAAQYAENHYFGKPCGLMDQTACAVGGFVAIDFNDPDHPAIEQIAFDFAQTRHTLCIVDTAGDHADLTEDYADIRRDMRAAAETMGRHYLRECSEEAFMHDLPRIRRQAGDRAVLRAMHFFAENERVLKLEKALRGGDFDAFKERIIESGRSSFMYLQNSHSARSPQSQGVPLALLLAERMLAGRGAWRVHGGGFAGTIQAFVPDDLLKPFTQEMNRVFGANATYRLMIRPVGAACVE